MSAKYPSLLYDFRDFPALPNTSHKSGKGLAMDTLPNLDTIEKSIAYYKFSPPIVSNYVIGGFDAHIQFPLGTSAEGEYAKRLYTRIRYQFPELRIYTFFEHPVGPFTTGSFEVSLRSPLELGTMVAWLIVHRGPLSVLVHPNTESTGDEYEIAAIDDHTKRAIWLGDPVELNLDFFKKSSTRGEALPAVSQD
jgi:aromatic ring-cleaving dioxygenase